MNTVYIVMHEDKHIDTEPYPFDDRSMALSFAKGIVEGYKVRSLSYAEEDDKMNNEMVNSGWIFYTGFEIFDAAVWVVEREMNSGAVA